MQVSAIQLIITVLGSNVALVGLVVFMVQRFGPSLFGWMRGKIDTKNGEISELVGETRKLAGDISRLAQAICQQVDAMNNRQDTFLASVQGVCDKYVTEVARLVERIEEGLGRTA